MYLQLLNTTEMFWSKCRIKIRDFSYIKHLTTTSIFLVAEDVEPQNFLDFDNITVKKKTNISNLRAKSP